MSKIKTLIRAVTKILFAITTDSRGKSLALFTFAQKFCGISKGEPGGREEEL